MIEQPAESRAAANPSYTFDLRRAIDDFVVESLGFRWGPYFFSGADGASLL
jgi:hypothetical protein